MSDIDMQEKSRLIIALRARGWSDTEINDLVLYMKTGKEEYLKKLTGKEKSKFVML